MPRQTLPLAWTLGHAPDLQHQPARWVPATVPGAVQLDWAAAEGWPPHWYAEEFRRYGWMEDCYWIYRAQLPSGTAPAGHGLHLAVEGVDYACTVRVDGVALHTHEGLLTGFELDLTGRARPGSLLEIAVHPAPKVPGLTGSRQANQSTKPAVSYGWDFHPRLIPLGIWQPLRLEWRPALHLRDAETFVALAEDLSGAELRLAVEASAALAEGSILWELIGPDGATVFSRRGAACQTARVERPALWWPLGEGAQPLYRSRVSLLDTDGRAVESREQRIGFRRIRLVMGEGAWERKHERSTQAPVPMVLEVNGREIFARGANWVPPGIFPGTFTAETYRPLLDLFTGAHLNFLRAWGGGAPGHEVFFDECDRRGLLVWQEFPLACNRYEGTPAYLAALDRESRALIRRVRRHACLAVWCGGNELFNAWSRMTMQDAALRLLDRNCYELDPATPYLHTSPLFGVRHGDYRFRIGDTGEDALQFYAQQNNTAYLEFGMPGAAPADRIREFIPEAELFPPRLGTSWESHGALNSWDMDRCSWLMANHIEHYFGPSRDLEELVARSGILQEAGYKAIYEEARRQKGANCSIAACWVFNEPWPCAANNSLLTWPHRPKPGYYGVQHACRPLMLSARLPRFDWSPGEALSVQPWLLNDLPQPDAGAACEVLLVVDGREQRVGTWASGPVAANRHASGGALPVTLPARGASDTFEVVLRCAARPELSSRYTLAWRRA